MRPLDIRHITVRAGALDLQVACPLELLHVDERLAHALLDRLPNLAHHVCVNGRGETLADELLGTELPHVLEHVIIELQGQRALGAGSASFSTGSASLSAGGATSVYAGQESDADQRRGTDALAGQEAGVPRAQGAGRGAFSFTGHTSWLEDIDATGRDGYALMRVTVTFQDDFAALRACEDARRLIEDCLAAPPK